MVCLDHCGVNTAGNWAAGRLGMGMLFHAMISVIRSEGDAPGKRAELEDCRLKIDDLGS